LNPGVDVRALLAGLEEWGVELRSQLAYLAVQGLELDEQELRGARRRALLLLASGGDPRRDLDPESRAVSSVADDLDTPSRRAALLEGLAGLREQADGLPAVEGALDELLADDGLAWHWAACALLAEELSG
jgi:hypothetical protein